MIQTVSSELSEVLEGYVIQEMKAYFRPFIDDPKLKGKFGNHASGRSWIFLLQTNQQISTGRESTNEFLKRESEATISYLDERKKNERIKDDLSVAALKAAIRAHESEVEANEAKKAAWYLSLLENQGSNYPAPHRVNYAPEWQD